MAHPTVQQLACQQQQMDLNQENKDIGVIGTQISQYLLNKVILIRNISANRPPYIDLGSH